MDDIIRISLMKAGAWGDAHDLYGSSPDPANREDVKVTPATFRDERKPVLVIDARGHIQDANEAALLFLDQELESLKSMAASEVILRLDEEIVDLVFKAAPLGRPMVIEAFCVRRDGTMIPCETHIGGIGQNLDGAWQAYLVLAETVQKHDHHEAALMADARLARAERLEMAGVVAGQIAHDFNNLLTPMLAYPELIRQEVPGNATVGEYLGIIEKTVGDMSRLTQQLLSLAGRGRVGMEVFNINEVISQVVATMQPAIAKGITVEFDLADNLLGVTGSRDQMRRVLDNLCQNALDAMRETGTLRLKTENVYLDTPVGGLSAIKIGEYVKITVSDSGPGIPDEIRDKIFDPFFTTKRASKKRGSGLGLSIVHGIIRDHHGYIDLVSSPGQGATFVMYIPISRSGGENVATSGLPRGTERILVVDDDPPQVALLVQLLEVLGYKATGVASGEDCLNLLKKHKQSFDLIILDMVMERGMDGLDTFVEIRRLVPDQRVLLISGYVKAARRIGKAQELGAGMFLRKPLTIARVAKAVREELDKGAAGDGAPVAPKRGRRVLVVDDETMIRKVFGMIILSEFPDAVIDHASNGDEALVAFRESLPDLVVMDLQMPVRDGRETFSLMEKYCIESGKTVPPVIFCTGFTPSSAMASIITDSPIHCLLRKPVKAEALLDAVRNRLRY